MSKDFQNELYSAWQQNKKIGEPETKYYGVSQICSPASLISSLVHSPI